MFSQKLRAAIGALFVLVLGTAATPSVSAAQQVDLVLNESDSPDPVAAGGLVTYSFTVTNDGTTTATGVSFTMAVPAGTKYAGFTGTGISCSGMTLNAAGPGTITCTLPNLIFGASTSGFTIKLRSVAAGLINISASVTSTEPDLQTSNNSITETTTVVAGADFGVTLSAAATVASGASLTYTLGVTNNGPDAATSLKVQFPLPTGFSLTSGLPAGCSNSAGTISCTIAGPIASGGSASIGTLTGQVYVASGSTVTGSASIALQASPPLGTAQDPDATNNTAVTSTTVTAGSDVAITKSRSASAPYFVGGTFNFTLTPTFTGSTPTGLTVTDVVPGNYTIGSVAASQNGWACSVAGQTVTCTKATGAAAGLNVALGVITIPVTINAAGSGVTNTATISATSPTDPNAANNTATDGGATLQVPTADLSVSKTGPNPALAVTGQAFNYTVTATNNGPSVFYGTLTVLDSLPAGLKVNSITATGWSCSPATPVTGAAVISCSRTYTSGSPLASGSNAPAITLNTTALTAGVLTNVAHVTTTSPNVPDGNSGNDGNTSTVTASPPAGSTDLTLVKTVDSTTVAAGNPIVYTIELVNNGPVAATSVTMTDVLGTLINSNVGASGAGYIGHTLTANSATGFTCSSSSSGGGRTLTCQVATLPPCTIGVSCPKVDVSVRPGGNGGTRSNTASIISADTADTDLSNNSASVNLTVVPRADVTVALTATPSPGIAGQDVVYVATATNNGPSSAANVTIDNLLPVGMAFTSATPSAGSCSVTPGASVVTTLVNRSVTCNLGTIANGGQATLTIRAKPTTPTRGTTLSDTANVSTTTTEPAPGAANNQATKDVPVAVPSLDLLINHVDTPDPVTMGANTVHTITVTNVGPSDGENIVVADTLPGAGLSFQSYTLSVGSCGTVPAVNDLVGNISCTIPRLASGATATLTVTMLGVTKGVYTSKSTVASDETGLGYENSANNTATQATTVRTRADMEVVSVTPSASAVSLRRPYTWTYRIRNNTGVSLAEADTVRVSTTLPSGMELTAAPTAAIVSGTTTLLACTGSAGSTSFNCPLGTVSSGAVIDITVPVRSLTVPAGGTSTNTVTVTTSSQDMVPANDSNNGVVTIQASSIAGTVFRDFNNNAAIDAGDTGMSGIVMTLSGTAWDGATVSATTATTDASGNFTISNVPEGTYTLARGTAGSALLLVGTQTAGTQGGTATTPPNITAIALGDHAAGTGYLFAFIPQARIGVAKRVVGSITANADASFSATTRVLVRNYALETLNSVSVTDALAGAAPAFGTYVAGGSGATLAVGEYTINSAPAFTAACTGGTAGSSFDGNGTNQLMSITSLAASASCEVEFIIRFRPTVPLPGGGYSNQASGSGTGALSAQTPSDVSQNGTNADPDANGDPTNNSVVTPYTATLTADVGTTVTFPATVNAGQSVSGTVLFKNNGPYSASSVTYALTLSSNLTGVTFGNLPVGANASYNSTNGVVTFTGMPTTLTVGQIASGDGTTGITVSYTQNGAASSSVSATIGTSTNQGANTNADTGTASIGGLLIADVTTVLSLPASADAGTTVNATLLFKNNGPSTASGLTYGLTLSTGLTGVTFGNLPAGASASYASGTGVVTFSTMPATAASGATISGNGTSAITVAWTQNGTASSTAASTISTTTNQGANAAQDSDNGSVTGNLVADVTTTLSFPALVNAGFTVNGTVVFKNNGPSTASGMTYSLTLTAGLSGVSFGNLPGGASATYVSGTGVVTLTGMPSTLASGAIASGNGSSGITVSYTQNALATSDVASGIGTTTGQGANVALDNATANTGGVLVADVRALVSFPASVNAGQTVNGTVSFSNTGPSTGAGITYSLTLSSGLGTVTFGNLPVGANASYNNGSGVVTFTGMPSTLVNGAIASGDGSTGITVSYTQPGSASSAVSATIGTSTNQGSNVAPDTDTATIGGSLIADVTTTVSVPASADAGTAVATTVVFKNNGPSTASGMTYSLTLTAGLAGVTFGNLPVGASASYASGTGIVTFTAMPSTLASGAIASGNGTSGITVNWTQNGTASSGLNSGIGTTTSQGANAAPDAASATVTGQLIADVTTTLSFPVSVNAGSTVSGTIVFTNNGPSIASGMTYSLTLTTGLAGVTFGNLPGGASANYNSVSGVVTFTGMPTTLAMGAIASGDGTSGITLSYTQPGTATSTVTSGIGTTTNQGANAALDAASANTGGALIADVRSQVTMPALVTAGSTVSGTVKWSNLGPSTASGVTYALTLTTGLTNVTFSNLPVGASASYNNLTGAVTFTGMPATLAMNAVASGDGTNGIGVSYTQNGIATTAVTATIGTSTSQGANVAPDTDTANIGGALLTDVTTTITMPAIVTPGTTVNAEVVYRNLGPSPANAATYTLVLSPSLTNVNVGNLPGGASFTYNPTTGVVTLTGMPATIQPGTIASANGTTGLAVSYTQAAAPRTTVSSTIGTSTPQGANVAPDAATADATGLVVDLVVEKTTTTVVAQPDQSLTYRVRVTNRGPDAAPAGSRLIEHPESLTLVSVKCASLTGNLCTTAPTVSTVLYQAELPTIPVGGIYELEITATPTIAKGTVRNSVEIIAPSSVYDNNPFNNTASVATPVTDAPNLSINKSVDGPLFPGNLGSYTISVRNGGGGPTTGAITVRDVLPASLIFVSASGSGWNCSMAGQSLTCTYAASLARSAATSFGLSVRVAPGTTGTITNTATVSTPGDATDGVKSSTAITPVAVTPPAPPAGPDLTLTKIVDRDTLRLGMTATYSLTVENVGTASASNSITVTDDLPTALTPTAASGAGFTCTIAGQRVTCTRSGSPLAAGAKATILVTVAIAPTATPGLLLNTACAATSDDVRTSNDCGTVTTPIAPRNDLTVHKEGVGDFVVGTVGDWRLFVKNTAKYASTGPITLIDSLPNGLTYSSATGNGWSCGASGSVVRCTNPGPIAIGDSSEVHIYTMVGLAALPSVSNCAVVTAPGMTVLTQNGRTCTSAKASKDYRLALELSTPQYVLELGDTPEFTVTVRNVGKSPLPDVVLTNLLPKGFTYVGTTSRRSGSPVRDVPKAAVTTSTALKTAVVAGAAPDSGIADPLNARTDRISWPLGGMFAGDVVYIKYQAKIRVGASFNRDNITHSIAESEAEGLTVTSNTATVPIALRTSVFGNRGIVAGKVFVSCQCGPTDGQHPNDLGVPGVRVMLEDGTTAITDAEGKYSFTEVRAGMHVVKVDRATLPPGAELVALDTRNAGDGASRFVDLKSGELHRADFVEASRAEAVLDAVLRRRREGEARAQSDSMAWATPLVGSGGAASTMPMGNSMPAMTMAPSSTFGTGTTSGFGSQSLQLSAPASLTSGGGLSAAAPIQSPIGLATTTRQRPMAGTPMALADGEAAKVRPLTAVGLFTGRLDFRSVSRGGLDLSQSADAFEDAMRTLRFTSDSGRLTGGARGALFLKGNVQGGLLTLSYDSERDRQLGQFRDFNPDEGFALTGDAALREFDAQSTERLYARYDRGRSFVRYGDFATSRGDDRRVLAQYDRSLTGLFTHTERGTATVNAFASRNRIHQVTDELAANGLSGPFFFTRANAVPNSERVEVITRDRNQPALIVRRQLMTRWADYTVEPATGRLVFRAPIASLDEQLNPQFIRVSYEVEQGGGAFMTYGTDATWRAAGWLELGAFAARDENPVERATLWSANARAKLGASTVLTGEFAHSDVGTVTSTGDAWRLDLSHKTDRVEFRAFAVEGDTSFNNRSSTFSGGRNEYGARFAARLGARTRLLAEMLRTEDAKTGGRRDGALLALERRVTPGVVAELGYRWADETSTPATTQSTGLSPIALRAARARLTSRLPGSDRASMFVEYEHGLDGGNAHRGVVGGEYRLTDRARLYARHEWTTSREGPYAQTDGQVQENTVFGIDADYVMNSQVFSEYRARDAFSGRDAQAAIGLRNRWTVAPGVRLGTSFERVSVLKGSDAGAAFAIGTGLEWTRSPLAKGTARLEWRTAPTGESFLGTLGYARKLSRDWTLLGRSTWDELQTHVLRGRSQLGFAWRQTDANQVDALFRLENRFDQADSTGRPETRTVANVAAALLNYRPTTRLTLSARYAGKLSTETRKGVTANTTAQLLMGRTVYAFTSRVDAGLIGSVLGDAGFAQRSYGMGSEVGVVVMRNLRLAGGYNFFGFTDRDFSSLGYTQRGPYLEFGFKFDERLFSSTGKGAPESKR